MSTKALQQFVEKVVIFTKANNEDNLGEDCVAFFAEYASLLASQGRLDVAAKYLYGDNVVENILRDRLYQSTPNKPAGQKAPTFPFVKVMVAAPGAVSSNKPAARGGVAAVQNAQQNVVKVTPAVQQTQQRVPEPTQPVAPTLPTLPAGWIHLQDPSSGRTYFVNQATGVSQWEAPVAEQPAVQPSPQHVPQQQQASGYGQPSANSGGYGQQQQNPAYGQQKPVVTQFNPAVTTTNATPTPGPGVQVKEVVPTEPVVDTSVIAPVVQELTNVVNMVAG